ncbi:SPW repeat domain-containing protein [Halalkalicoccus salilacus]
MSMRSPTRWITAVNGVLGLWLIAAPFLVESLAIAHWNDLLVGGVIVIVAGYNFYSERTQGTINQRVAAINGVLGGWLIVAPFVYGLSGIALWNNVCVGVVVTSFAGYNVYAAPRIDQSVTTSSSEDAS